MSTSRILKWVSGGIEAFLGIPLLGAIVVMGTSYSALFAMLILHIITLIFTRMDRGVYTGSILGIITSCIAWIPFVGMIMHMISAIFLMLNAATRDQENIVIREQ